MQVLSYIPANLQSMEITGEAPPQTDDLVAKRSHWLKPIDSGSWINNLRSLSVIQHQFALYIMCDTKTEPLPALGGQNFKYRRKKNTQ